MIKLLLLTILAIFSTTSMAAAPMIKTQAPGYYRYMLGDFEVTALFDGTIAISSALLNNPVKSSEADLKKSFLSNPTETSVNAYLINTGAKLILIDTGAAALFGPSLGKLGESLKASGYTPEQVDEVYVTHLHNDHIGGLFAGQKVVFPNAVIRADKHELDFWINEENLAKAPKEMKGFFEGPINTFAAYTKAGKVKSFEGDTQLVDGIKAMNTHGHTAGHIAYLVESKGQKMIVIGDLIHVAGVQLKHPEVTIQYDSNTKEASAQRKKIFEEAAKEGYVVAAAHISFPGLGRLIKDGKKYTWLPVNYLP